MHILFVLGLLVMLCYIIGEYLSWKVLSKKEWYHGVYIKEKEYSLYNSGMCFIVWYRCI